jgi:hypothetical protein
MEIATPGQWHEALTTLHPYFTARENGCRIRVQGRILAPDVQAANVRQLERALQEYGVAGHNHP